MNGGKLLMARDLPVTPAMTNTPRINVFQFLLPSSRTPVVHGELVLVDVDVLSSVSGQLVQGIAGRHACESVQSDYDLLLCLSVRARRRWWAATNLHRHSGAIEFLQFSNDTPITGRAAAACKR